MSITDELRQYVTNDCMHYCSDYLAIADRIDAEHESACAEAYGNGVMSVPIALDESAWVELPKDADGAPIHVGDVMEGVDKYDTLKEVMGKVITVSFESDGTVDVAIQAWSIDGKSWHRTYLDPDASVYRHHRTPTVEDVLREFGRGWHEQMNGPETFDVADYVERYAAKLRLAGDAS